MSIQRQVPIAMEPSRLDFSDAFFRDPMFASFRDPMTYRDPTRDLFAQRDLVRDPFVRDPIRDAFVRDPIRDAAVYPAAVGPVSTLPLSRAFFNPERQLGVMDTDLQRMATEMRRMFSDMQHLMPVDANPESWRMKENFHLDNPVHQDQMSGRNIFRLQFDVRQFKPEEIFVKTLGNQLTVHARHEEKHEGKSLLREYNRQYVLPKDLNPENLVSKLNRDGILTIEAPLPITDGPKDKLIPIKHE
ncbi:unnamed protein product [Lymnaea stagnalis]|uniref:SHSP domain-containing protein n=1 Tax=Lymnaea stagnalis TaxID=6523 RepID=A0AAV2H832_LYMST